MFIYKIYLREHDAPATILGTSFGKGAPTMSNDGGLDGGGYQRSAGVDREIHFYNGDQLMGFFNSDDVQGITIEDIPTASKVERKPLEFIPATV